jgi:hypothetical protein
MGQLYTLQRRDRAVVLAKAATGTMVTNHGIVFRLNHRHQWEPLYKAGRRRRVSPGQLDLFGGPRQGDTKVENGITYQLNANSRWERVDKDAPASQEKAAEPAIVPVIEEQPAQGYKKLIQKAERMFGEELRAIDKAMAKAERLSKPLEKRIAEIDNQLNMLRSQLKPYYEIPVDDFSKEKEAEFLEIAVKQEELFEEQLQLWKKLESVQKNPSLLKAMRSLKTRLADPAGAGWSAQREKWIDPNMPDFNKIKEELEILHYFTGNQVSTLENISFRKDDSRASATPPVLFPDIGLRAGQISLKPEASIDDQLRAFWHEFGHHLEYSNYSYWKAATEWRQSRSASDTPVSLREIAPFSNYGKEEVAFPGTYIDPYVGKFYDHSGVRAREEWNTPTEVISVGLENFASFDTMAGFYRKDREHFLLILGMLRPWQPTDTEYPRTA